MTLEAWRGRRYRIRIQQDEAVGLGVATRHRLDCGETGESSSYGGMYGENKGEEEGATSFGLQKSESQCYILDPSKVISDALFVEQTAS